MGLPLRSFQKVLSVCLPFIFQSLDAIITLDSLGYRVHFQQALEQYNHSRFRLAEDYFHAILTQDRDYTDPAAQLMLAKSQYRQGDLNQALRTCKSYISSYPGSPYEIHAQILMGDILLKQGQITSAFKRYLQVRSMSTDSIQSQGIDERILNCIANDIDPHRLEGLLFQEQDGPNRAILNLARAYASWKNGNRYDLELILGGRMYSEFPPGFQTFFQSLSQAMNRKFFNQSTIAVVLPITGPNSGKSLSYLAGLSEFIDENITQIAVRFIVFDTEGNDVKALEILRKIALNRTITGILGPMTDSQILIASGTTLSLPILIPKTGLTGLAEISDNVFFLSPTDRTIAQRTAQLLIQEMGLEQIAILSPGDGHSLQMTKFFISELNQLGIEPIALEWYHDEPENISRQFKSIRQKAWALVPEEDSSVDMMDMTIDSLEGLFDVDVDDFFNLPDGERTETMSKRDSAKIFLNTIQALYLPLRVGELTYIGTQVPLYNLDAVIIGNENWLDMDVLNQDVIGPHVQGMRIISDVQSSMMINEKLQFSNYYALGFDQGDFINSISSISSGTRRSFYQNLKRKAYFGGRTTSIQLGGKNKNSNQSVQVLEYRNKSIRSIGVFNGDSLQVTLP